jgi:hypothetical protein
MRNIGHKQHSEVKHQCQFSMFRPRTTTATRSYTPFLLQLHFGPQSCVAGISPPTSYKLPSFCIAPAKSSYQLYLHLQTRQILGKNGGNRVTDICGWGVKGTKHCSVETYVIVSFSYLSAPPCGWDSSCGECTAPWLCMHAVCVAACAAS